MTIDNNLLGEFTLAGIPPAPRGVEKLDVTFDIDANGILNVTAINQSTGRQSAITITNNVGRLSQNDINRMIDEAKFYKQEDDKKLERIAAKNSLEDYLYKLKKEAFESMIPEHRKKIMKKINEVYKWLDTNALAKKVEFEHQLKVLEDEYNFIINNQQSQSQNDINCVNDETKLHEKEDDKKHERIAAKNSLENYVYKLKKEAIKTDCQKILNEIDKVCKWLDANTLAEKDEYVHKLKKLKSNPIITKLYQQAGGFPDDDDSGSAGSGDDVKSGPIIEEVD